ncbi:MAG: CBS domain-containing protein [Armatimonadetes bacterium]|nr:CBS domain-containing protein [Armatimonadota bacterium]
MEVNVKEVLKASVPFSSLDEATVAELAGHVEVKTYPRGAYVFRQGQKSLQVLFLIASGLGEVTLTDDRGQETVVSYRRQHDFFGETALLTDKSYGGSVRAAEDLTCLLVPREKIEELIASHPEFAGFFTALLSERLRLLYEETVAQQSYEAYSTTESPLLRKRVSEIMTPSPVTCRLQTPVTSVARLMADYRISSVIVVDDAGYPVGLITEKDLVHKVVTRPSWQAENLSADLVMDEKLVRVQIDDFYNQALLAVVKHQVKHLVVMDGDKLAGILTLRDLIKTRSTGSLWVTDKIETAKNLDDLAKIGQEVDNFLNYLVAERASVPELFEIITEMHDRLTCRVIELCEQEMIKKGYGPPPGEYCWVNMGSAGRKEQSLRTDQDNAIIYAAGDPAGARYFQTLGARIAEELVRAGFAWCKGGVMASNPQWCRSLTQWKEVVTSWVVRAEPEDIRLLTILLDFRPVYGAKNLGQELWQHIFHVFQKPVKASHFLTEEEVRTRVPLTFFGGFATEKTGPHKNEINLKTACRHIINCVRVFAVRNEIEEPSTLGRLARITKREIISKEDGEFVQNAFETLMMLRIRENLKKVRQGKEADNYINPYQLNKTEQSLLKDAFAAILRLQKLTSNHFTDYWLRYLTS